MKCVRCLSCSQQLSFLSVFSQGMLPCERADVSRRVLTMHGFKNMTQMWEVFRSAFIVMSQFALCTFLHSTWQWLVCLSSENLSRGNRYTTEDWDLGCMIDTRNYAHKQNHELWGKPIDQATQWINPIGKTSKLNMALVSSALCSCVCVYVPLLLLPTKCCPALRPWTLSSCVCVLQTSFAK